MIKNRILVVPCATQIGVEQYMSLEYNKAFKLIGASHNEKDELFENFIKLNHPITTSKFEDEIIKIVEENNIQILLPSHDEVLYILKNNPKLQKLIPGNCKKTINICRFKNKTYKKLQQNIYLENIIPKYQILPPGFLKPDKGQGSRGSLNITQNYLHCEYLPGEEYTIDCFSNNNEVVYINPRLRKEIINGISETTSIVFLPEIEDIAKEINKTLQFNGSWFFQMKQDINGNLKLLEVAPRIGGGSNINRLNGVNLTLSDLYQHLGHKIEILPQNLTKEINRKNPKYNLNFKTIFVDYDDTFEYVKDTLNKLEKEIIVITRSKVKVNTPYKTIYVKDNEYKSEIINNLNKHESIFIDDSFKERKDIILNCNIPSLTPEETKYLV